MQANWIGKSTGVRFAFRVNGVARSALGSPPSPSGRGNEGEGRQYRGISNTPHPIPLPEGEGE